MLTGKNGILLLLLLLSGPVFAQARKAAIKHAVPDSIPHYNLDTVTVFARPRPLVIRKDTMEYNAGSFPTRDHDNVAALLRLLPGIQVTDNGELKINGQEIQQVLVDGEPFFDGRTGITIKMLPAEIINKVQVFDAASNKRNFTGIEDGQRTKTLNLTIKNNRRKGSFGQIGLGGGDQGVYGAETFLNNFYNSRQLSLTAQALNAGSPLAGPATEAPGNSGGIVNSRNAGLNYRDKWGSNTTVNGNYFYRYQDALNEQGLLTRYIFPGDSTTDQHQNSKGNNSSKNHAANLNIQKQISSQDLLVIRSNLSFTQNQHATSQESTLSNGKGAAVYNSAYQSSGQSRGNNIATKVSFAHKFKQPLRTLSVDVDLLSNTNHATRYNLSVNHYFLPLPRSDTLNQLRNNTSSRAQIKADLSYSEPIGDRQALTLSYGYRRLTGKTDVQVFRYDRKYQQYNEIDSTQSSALENFVTDHYLKLAWQLNRNRYTLLAGSSLLAENFVVSHLHANQRLAQHYLNLLPTLNFNYNLSDSANIRFSYDMNMRQPGIEQLQPVTSTADSLYIIKGNPYLQQVQTHSFSLIYQKNQPLSGKMFMAGANAGITTNDIQYSTTQMPDGTQVTMPVNVNGAFDVAGNINYTFPGGRSRAATFSLLSGLNYRHNINILNGLYVHMNNVVMDAGFSLTASVASHFSASLNANANYNITAYTPEQYQAARYFSGRIYGNVRYQDGKWLLSAAYSIFYNNNTQAGFKRWVPVVSPYISRQLFKHNNGELKLNIADLFNQNTGLARTVSANTVQTINTNTRRRYVMLSFIYNLRRF